MSTRHILHQAVFFLTRRAARLLGEGSFEGRGPPRDPRTAEVWWRNERCVSDAMWGLRGERAGFPFGRREMVSFFLFVLTY